MEVCYWIASGFSETSLCFEEGFEGVYGLHSGQELSLGIWVIGQFVKILNIR